jgi:hypothetical protein
MKKVYVTPVQTCICIKAILPIAASYDASVGISTENSNPEVEVLSRLLDN